MSEDDFFGDGSSADEAPPDNRHGARQVALQALYWQQSAQGDAQAALADFIADGYLTSHIRRMRALYEDRQTFFIETVREILGDKLRIAPDEAGMHLVGHLPDDADDAELSKRARAAGVVALPLSAFYRETPHQKGLLFGYAGVPAAETRRAIERLATVFAGD